MVHAAAERPPPRRRRGRRARRRVRYGLLDRREQAGLGLPWSPALVTRAVHACGSTLAAARAALDDGVAATLGGGMHHAGHRLGRGYCTFNDVAVAIAALRAEGAVRRVLILDLDVHQGDGNAELFGRDAACAGLAARRAQLPVHAGAGATSTSSCRTAPATTATWRARADAPVRAPRAPPRSGDPDLRGRPRAGDGAEGLDQLAGRTGPRPRRAGAPRTGRRRPGRRPVGGGGPGRCPA